MPMVYESFYGIIWPIKLLLFVLFFSVCHAFCCLLDLASPTLVVEYSKFVKICSNFVSFLVVWIDLLLGKTVYQSIGKTVHHLIGKNCSPVDWENCSPLDWENCSLSKRSLASLNMSSDLFRTAINLNSENFS